MLYHVAGRTQLCVPSKGTYGDMHLSGHAVSKVRAGLQASTERPAAINSPGGWRGGVAHGVVHWARKACPAARPAQHWRLWNAEAVAARVDSAEGVPSASLVHASCPRCAAARRSVAQRPVWQCNDAVETQKSTYMLSRPDLLMHAKHGML